MKEPNYSTYSVRELYDVLGHIDSNAHPDRYNRLIEELRKRNEDDEQKKLIDELLHLENFQTIWPRFWANHIDRIIISGGIFLLYWTLFDLLDIQQLKIQKMSDVIYFTVLQFSYSIVLHAKTGQTIGKMIMGVKVLTEKESKIGYWHSILRDSTDMALYLSLFYSLYSQDHTLIFLFFILFSFWTILDIITTLVNKKRRSLHDFIAGTVVMKT